MSKRKTWRVKYGPVLRPKFFAELYQLAGQATSGPIFQLTEGQQDRLRELLMDALYEPERYTAKNIRDQVRLALKP